MNFKQVFASVLLAGLALTAFALPTVDAVQAEISRGNYAQAETMMGEVVAAKPGSAKAHYIYAEILAHNQRFDRAAEQAAQARTIDSSLQFTQPEKFRAFEQLLERERSAAKRAANAERSTVQATPRQPSQQQPSQQQPSQQQGGGFPAWLWGLGGAAVALLAWRMFSGQRQPAAAAAQPAMAQALPAGAAAGGYGQAYPAPQPPGYGPQGGYAPQAPRSGLLGTGLAVAGGVAAGMLAEKLFEGHRDSGLTQAGSGSAPGLFDNAQADDGGSRDLEQRPIDFGTGNDWGGDDGASGGGGGDDGW